MRLNTKKFLFRLILPVFIISLIILSWTLLREEARIYTLEWGFIESKAAEAVVVRDEEVINAEDYGFIEYNVLEGTNVAAGQSIAMLYRKDYVPSVLENLYSLRNDIYKYQKENLYKDIDTPDLVEIDSNIAKAISDMIEAVRSPDNKDFTLLQSNLQKNLAARAEYLKNNLSSNQYLTKLYSDETKYLNNLSTWQINITSPRSGYVSFGYDGLEHVLNVMSLQNMDLKYLRTALKNINTRKVQDAEAKKPLYRLVNGDKWWIVAELDKNMNLVKNSKINIKVFGLAGEFSAVVNDCREDNNGKIAVLELSGDITPFLSLRNITVSIGTWIEGFKVPDSAIKKTGNTIGIYVGMSNGQRRFVPVEVLGSERGYSIIKSLDSSFELQVNQAVYKKGK
ncbi:MAG TPA: HlyD family efflux transporter periplasmic adaptor subunit [Clostridia bacterium]|nr:HlyD family efflux transporter periplasmic adaptor subunit [Clostridia bacterium]